MTAVVSDIELRWAGLPGEVPVEFTLTSHVETYLRGRARRGELGRLSLKNYRGPLHRFAESFGQRPVSRLGRADVERWMETLGGKSPGTKVREFYAVVGFVRWLMREQGRADFTYQLHAPARPRRVPRALQREVVTATLHASADARTRAVVILMVQLGLRRCEVARLQYGDVDEANRSVHVAGKFGNERVLHLTDEAMSVLSAYLDERGRSAGALIRSTQPPCDSLHPESIYRLVRKAMVDAGVKRGPRDGVCPHALRHTALTDMVRSGAPVRDVQRVAGHASIQTTEAYVLAAGVDVRSTMEGRSYS